MCIEVLKKPSVEEITETIATIQMIEEDKN